MTLRVRKSGVAKPNSLPRRTSTCRIPLSPKRYGRGQPQVPGVACVYFSRRGVPKAHSRIHQIDPLKTVLSLLPFSHVVQSLVIGIPVVGVNKWLEKFDHTTRDRVLQQKSSRRPSLCIDHLDSPSNRFGGFGDRAAQKRKLSNALHCVALTSWSQTAQRPIASARLALLVHGRDLCSGDARMRKDGSFADRRCFRSTPVLPRQLAHTKPLQVLSQYRGTSSHLMLC